MNIRTTLVLVVLLLAMGLYFYYVELNAPIPDGTSSSVTTQNTQGTALFGIAPPSSDVVTKITIQRGDKIVELVKENADWFQTKPVRFALNNNAVESIINDAANLRYIDQFTPGDGDVPALADVKLDPPQAQITLAGADISWTIKLGRKLPGGNSYVMLGDEDQVFVVGDGLYSAAVDAKVGAWRKTSIDAPKAALTDRIILQKDGGEISLNKIDGQWFIGSQATQRAGEDKVAALVDAVGTIWIDDFVSDDPEDLSLYGLDQPRLTLLLRTPAQTGADDGEADLGVQGANTLGLRVGLPTDLKEEKYFATWSPTEKPSSVVFTISKSKLESLSKSVDDLRDPRVVTSRPTEVRELVIERRGQANVHLVRGGQALEFATEGNPGYGLDFNAATDLLEKISELTSEIYVGDYTVSAPAAATVSLSLRGAGATEVIKLYHDEEHYLAVRSSETVAYRLGAEAVSLLFKPLLTLRDKNVWDLGEAKIASITLGRDDGMVFTFTPTDDGWQLADHDTFESDSFEQLLDALRPLRVERWLGEAVKISDDNTLTLTVNVAEQSPRTLSVDAETGRGRLSDTDAAFAVPSRLLDLLTGEYRPRTVLALTSDQIRQVSIEDGDAVMLLSKDSSGVFVSDSAEPIDQAAAAGIFDTLAGLRVQRYASPLPMTVADVDRTLTVTATDGQSYHLMLVGFENRKQTVQITPPPYGGAGWFILDEAAMVKLRASLRDSE
jgi:hypothetical protein